ncbi:hypothetical protein [Brachybacterium sp.]|uniref:hypothetical protein n=1 Tax=Brachybacterium sp. TaxID=1891286 RepID=UPI002ED5280F
MPRLVDTLAAAHAARVKPALIRTWAARGKLARQGEDQQGRTLYALDDVYRLAARRPQTPAPRR